MPMRRFTGPRRWGEIACRWVRDNGRQAICDAAAVTGTLNTPSQLQSKGETMNKKFLIAWVVLFVAWLIGSFVVHGLLLRPHYMQLTSLFRAEGDQQKYFPLMLLAHAILSGAFVWIYARGVEAKPWMAQGGRFGVVAPLLTIVPTY